jgi:hypothetical protein
MWRLMSKLMVVRLHGGGNGDTFLERDKTHLNDERGFGKGVRIDVRRKDFDGGGDMSAWDQDRDEEGTEWGLDEHRDTGSPQRLTC